MKSSELKEPKARLVKQHQSRKLHPLKIDPQKVFVQSLSGCSWTSPPVSQISAATSDIILNLLS